MGMSSFDENPEYFEMCNRIKKLEQENADLRQTIAHMGEAHMRNLENRIQELESKIWDIRSENQRLRCDARRARQYEVI